MPLAITIRDMYVNCLPLKPPQFFGSNVCEQEVRNIDVRLNGIVIDVVDESKPSNRPS